MKSTLFSPRRAAVLALFLSSGSVVFAAPKLVVTVPTAVPAVHIPLALESLSIPRIATPEQMAELSATPVELPARAQEFAAAPAAADIVPASAGGEVFDGAASLTAAQSIRLNELRQIADLFVSHYAPKVEKGTRLGVDFKEEYKSARAQVLANPNISKTEFQAVLARFVSRARDYHAGISFYSTEMSKLPFSVLGAEGRYYLYTIDREALPEATFPFHAGDELAEFGGKPVAEALVGLTLTPNVAQTDARISQMRLTGRSRRSGISVPQGEVALKIKTADGASHDVATTWKYTPERLPDVPVEDGLGPESVETGRAMPSQNMLDLVRKAVTNLLPVQAHPQADLFAEMAAQDPDNGFMIGGKKSFVPELGEVIWRPDPAVAEKIPFTAYIYKDAQGRKIGYVRIPSYDGDESAAGIFARLIAGFQENTDALVIDQVNNPGGSVFYMYSLLSMLADKPLVVPQHQLMVEGKDAAWADTVIQQAQSSAAQAVKQVVADQMPGFAAKIDDMMQSLLRYARFLISELAAGRRLTGLVDLFGVGEIEPNSQVHYTKPIVVLINELDFSAGDFFPTILQDNKRAVLHGVRTAGAGGAVKSWEPENQSSIARVSYTWTLAMRTIGQPIEWLGVHPHVWRDITAQDIRGGFKDYAKSVNETVSAVLAGTITPNQPPVTTP